MELTRRDYASAAELFAEARDSLPGSEIQAAWLYGMRQGEALFRLGDEFDDSHALREAARAYAGCLAMTGRDEMPKNWAAAQCGLALAHQRLAERETETGIPQHGDRGVADGAGRSGDARRARPDAGQPAASGGRAGSGGRARWRQHECSDGAERGGGAVSGDRGSRSARAFAPRLGRGADGVGQHVAEPRRAHGTAGRRSLLANAVTALEAASSVYDREQHPVEWSQARMALGNAYLAIGERERGSGALGRSRRVLRGCR